MKTNLFVKLMLSVGFLGLAAWGNSGAGFEPISQSLDDLNFDQKASIDQLSMQASADGSAGTVDSVGGSVGSGTTEPEGPVIPNDLAGDYEYKSATLNFKVSLVNKQQSCGGSQTACIYLLPNVHSVSVQALGQCKAYGDESEKFIYENATTKSGSIKFSNFVSTRIYPCDKTAQAANLLALARTFSIDANGNLVLRLADARVLRLKLIPIDWNNAIGL